MLLLATAGCGVDKQVDGAGCALLVTYALMCGLQFAIPAIHRSPQFAAVRKRLVPVAQGCAITVTGVGTCLAATAFTSEPRFPTIARGSAALTVLCGFWALLWSYAEQKDEQAKYAKLVSLTVGVLIGLWFLASNGPKLF